MYSGITIGIMKQHICRGLFSWCLSSYGIDIHCYLKRRELKSKKMSFRSPQISYRSDLVNWLRLVSVKLKLSNITVHLGVRLLDLFMDSHRIMENKIIPIGLTCLVVAAKFEEEDSKIPKMKDLPALANNEASKADFAFLESYILKFFDWTIGEITAAHFAEYYMLFAVVSGDEDHFGTSHRNLQDLVLSTMRDFLDISLSEIRVNEYMSSKVAASCLLAARLEHGIIPVWPKTLSAVTGYSLGSLKPCLDLLTNCYKDTPRTDVFDKSCFKEDYKFDSGYESCSPDNPNRILLKK